MVKKRKKKVYNTAKKPKHVNENKPLNIIKSICNPKCQDCDNRLAVHDDRFTCSHCNLSFPLNIKLV